MRKRVYMCDKATMEIIAEYPNRRRAALANGLDFRRVSDHCEKRMAGKHGFVFRYADDYDPNERFRDGQIGRPVLRIDVRNDAARVFGTVKEAAKASCVADDTVYWHIRTGKPLEGRFVFDWAR